jgi:hypothetical protein
MKQTLVKGCRVKDTGFFFIFYILLRYMFFVSCIGFYHPHIVDRATLQPDKYNVCYISMVGSLG